MTSNSLAAALYQLFFFCKNPKLQTRKSRLKSEKRKSTFADAKHRNNSHLLSGRILSLNLKKNLLSR